MKILEMGREVISIQSESRKLIAMHLGRHRSSISSKSYGRMMLIVAFFLGIHIQYMRAQDSIKLAFGSCNKVTEDQSYWTQLGQQNLDCWVWLGDIVYADSKKPSVLKKKFKAQKTNPNYQAFASTHQIYGTWDDHDFGENDGGKDFKIRNKSRDILFDFLDVEKSNPARKREGAYQMYTIRKNDIAVKLILLDVRYFRDKLKPNLHADSRYLADVNAEILGEKQWQWLEAALNDAQEDLILIASGTQIIPTQQKYEKWADYPAERSRLLDVLRKHTAKRIVLLSGDRHMAEVSALAIDANHLIYEITSSGLTHTWSKPKTEENAFRIKSMYPVKNYGTLSITHEEDEIRVHAALHAINGELLDTYEIYPQ